MKIFYLGARFTRDSNRRLDDLREFWRLSNSTLSPKTGYHTTIIYSRKEFHLPRARIPDRELILAGKPHTLATSIVLPFDSSGDWFKAIHNDCLRKGASRDYPEYIPHVTIAETGDTTLLPLVTVDMISIKIKEIYYAEFDERTP